jgi:hypothetical protein
MSINNRNDLDSYQNSPTPSNNFSVDDCEIEHDHTSLPSLRRNYGYNRHDPARLMLPFALLIGIGTVLAMTIQLYRHGFDGTHNIHVDVGPSASNNILGLIWSDEFDGDTLDLTKWSFVNGNGCDVGLCGWGKISYPRR